MTRVESIARENDVMEERRGAARAKVNRLFNVVDRRSGAVIGNLVDISLNGLLLFSKAPVAVDAVWQLVIEVPAKDGAGGGIEFGAESLWSDAIGDPPVFWTGFQIIDLAPAARERIAALIDRNSG